MTEARQRRILVVTGDHTRASKLECALSHPGISVSLAGDEKVIVAELTGWAWDLALVGGHVGRRGPLVLCDAVKARRADLPTLVLVGQETDETELTAHEERGLEEVRYLDLRGASASIAELKSARIMALEMLALEEDDESAQAWPSRIASLEGDVEDDSDEDDAIELTDEVEEPGGAPPIVEQVTPEDLEFAQRTVSQTRHVDFRSPPPKTQAVDAGDRQTAKLRDRVRELERNIARIAHVYGGRLREFDTAAESIAESEARNESLRRDIERLRDHFAEEREHWKAHRVEVEGKAASLTERVQLLDARLHETTEEAGRLRRELELKEQSHAGVLQQVQEAFNALKETTAEATNNLNGQLAGLNQQLADTRQESERLAAELSRVHEERGQHVEAAREDLQARIHELEIEIDTAKQRHDAEVTARHDRNEAHIGQLHEVEERAAEQLRALEERANTELRQRGVELDGVRAQLSEASAREQQLDAQLRVAQEEAVRQQDVAQQARTEVTSKSSDLEQVNTERTNLSAESQALRAELATTQQELQRLSSRATEVEQQAVQARVDLQVAQETNAAELGRLRAERDELKAAASTFRDAHDEQSSSVAERDEELQRLKSDLEASTQELARLSEQHRDASTALERERSRSLETVLDARLAAVEEFSRAASEKISEQHEVLTLLDERSSKQERFVESLLGTVSVERSMPAESDEGDDHGGVAMRRDTDENLAKLARRLVDARVNGDAPRQSLWGWLRESPVHMIGALFCVAVVVAAVVVWLRSSVWVDDPPSVTASQEVASAAAEPSSPDDAGADAGAGSADAVNDTPPAEPEAATGAAPGAAPGAATEAAAEVVRPELSPEDTLKRRGLRNRFFEAVKNKRWGKAVELGTELRDTYFLDWESHLRLADAVRRTGDAEAAVVSYQAFVAEYPDNAFADEARLRSANLLVKLERTDEAVPLFEQLAANPKGKYRKPAKRALETLNR